MHPDFDFEGLSKDEIEIKLREYIDSAKNDPLYEMDRAFRIRILHLENLLNTLSDIRAEEISQKLLLEMQMDASQKETEKAFYELRQPVIDELKKNPSNELLQQTARHLMQMEKDQGLYDSDNWNDLPKS